MPCEEDSSLLFLIVQYLKIKGLRAAADVLEEHVSQVEMSNVSLNLQDIYKGWLKMCSPHADQPASGSDAPNEVESEVGADERPPEDNNTNAEAVLGKFCLFMVSFVFCLGSLPFDLALKSEGVEGTNGQAHNGCDSLQPEEEEQTQQEPEVVMDVKGETSGTLKSNPHQIEATPSPKEATNDCSDDDGNTGSQENRIGLIAQVEMFCANKQQAEVDVLPAAAADVTTERDKEEVVKEASDLTTQLEREDNQTRVLEAPNDGTMAVEGRDHLDVAITLNFEVGEPNACLSEEAAISKKKKTKKKKTAPEEDQKTEQNSLPKNKKGQKRKNEEEEQQEVGDGEGASVKKKKKKRRRREKGRWKEEVPSDGVTGGNAEPQKKLTAQGVPQLSSNQKRHRRKKRARMLKNFQQDPCGKDQTSPPKPSKRDVEEDAPKKKKTTQEEPSSKENQIPPSTTKKDKNTAASEEVEDAGNSLEDRKKTTSANEEAVEDVGDSFKAVKKKKKKRAANEVEDVAGNDSLEMKKKKMEAAQCYETPDSSHSSDKKKRRKKVKDKMAEGGDA
ncbi:myb-like protein V isoform X2 [Phyllopteryx taeniolatus]|uniref:myb-like protein V isoform X2 n=1 Tax=Phyllopteryx taeniolatus TaxID=161469 RepID=UPI002AD289D6|nr:myb-like protein V isoform X2 [Phyllopteryx taeniolatus]